MKQRKQLVLKTSARRATPVEEGQIEAAIDLLLGELVRQEIHRMRNHHEQPETQGPTLHLPGPRE